MMIWAHDARVARTGPASIPNMGQVLATTLGRDYSVVGFVFARGAFQAIDMTASAGSAGGLRAFTLGPPPDWDVSVPFTRTGEPLLFLDLRGAPAGIVADWLAAPHPMRETGAAFGSEAAMSSSESLSRRFDAVLFVDETTRARPLHATP